MSGAYVKRRQTICLFLWTFTIKSDETPFTEYVTFFFLIELISETEKEYKGKEKLYAEKSASVLVSVLKEAD